MNTRTIILIMGSVLIATVCILVSVFVYRLIFVNTDNTAVKNPSINIQLVTVPTKIDTICQPVTFLLNVKNTGEVDFNHDLFKNGLAQFDVIIKGVGDLILQSKTGGTTFDNLKITDFEFQSCIEPRSTSMIDSDWITIFGCQIKSGLLTARLTTGFFSSTLTFSIIKLL